MFFTASWQVVAGGCWWSPGETGHKEVYCAALKTSSVVFAGCMVKDANLFATTKLLASINETANFFKVKVTLLN